MIFLNSGWILLLFIASATTYPTTSSAGLYYYKVTDKIWINSVKPVYEGVPVELTCLANGFPSPTLTWRRSDSIYQLTSDVQTNVVQTMTQSVLRLVPRREDNGIKFKCSASQVGSQKELEASVTLEVHYPPTVSMNALYGSKEKGIVEGFQCLVEANPAPKLVHITKGDKFITDKFSHVKNTTYKSVVNFATVDDSNSGEYLCSASNGVKEPVLQSLSVHIFYPPIVTVKSELVVTSGESLSITCDVRAYPAPQSIQWTKEDDPSVLAFGSKLELHIVDSSSAGRYTCHAYNQIKETVEEGTASVDVRVLHAPGKPKISPSHGLVVTGGNITLTCTVNPTGWPVPDYKWVKISSDELMSVEPTLTISNAQIADTGLYKCLVSNKFGMARSDVRLDVIKPEFVWLPAEKTIPVGYANYSVLCSAQGPSVQPILWFKDGNLIESGDVYEIDNKETNYPIPTLNSRLRFRGPNRQHPFLIEASDAGTYTCTLTNEINSTMELIVEGPLTEHPAKFHVASGTVDSLSFEWDESFPGFAHPLYSIHYRALGGHNPTEVQVCAASVPCVVSFLNITKFYVFTLHADNLSGKTVESEPLTTSPADFFKVPSALDASYVAETRTLTFAADSSLNLVAVVEIKNSTDDQWQHIGTFAVHSASNSEILDSLDHIPSGIRLKLCLDVNPEFCSESTDARIDLKLTSIDPSSSPSTGLYAGIGVGVLLLVALVAAVLLFLYHRRDQYLESEITEEELDKRWKPEIVVVRQAPSAPTTQAVQEVQVPAKPTRHITSANKAEQSIADANLTDASVESATSPTSIDETNATPQ